MSPDQNALIQTGPPRRFLRKGEGLKRFAAYKPPLPTTAKKVERRQTFVRFKLDRNSATVTKDAVHFIPPEILNDDSINLSTEIPKIAPPKIIHTPIRPNRNALGTLTNESSLFSDSQINGNIDNLFKKIEEKKSALLDKEECSFLNGGNDDTASFNYTETDQDNLREDRKINQPTNQSTQAKKRDACSPERQAASPKKESRIAKSKRTVQVNSRLPSAPNSIVLELTKHVEKIECTVNELREKLKDCACCAPVSLHTTRRRPTTRATAKAAKSKADDAKPNGPSAVADKNTTKERLESLANDFALLKARLDEIHRTQ